MRNPGKGIAIVLACLCAGLGSIAAFASAASQAVTPSVDCCTFSAANFTIDAGTVASLQNDTTTTHDVSASSKGPDGKPLFSSPQINMKTASINGTQYLAPDDYAFKCTIHGGMNSTLTVLPGGVPQARPSADVQISNQKLSNVALSGKLTTTVKGKVAATGIILVAKKGNKTLGTMRNINVPAGAKKTVKIPLTGAGKKALKDLTSASITVQATVPFGKTDKATRKLK